MRLSAAAEGPPPFERAWAVMDGRLAQGEPAPVLVSFSGGGDSLALLLAAQDWARRAGRPLVAITVDHGLRPESAQWAAFCARRCETLGVAHLVRRWEGPRPSSGLSAAARAARHRLLAEAAHACGARVVLLGHTADDVAEAELMRSSGSTTPSPREWGPSPAWPEGRGVFLLRPLLGARRADLRTVLAALGERWIEDPANADPSSARARARAEIAHDAAVRGDAAKPAAPGRSPFDIGAGGELACRADALLAAPPADSRAWLGAALVCAAGSDRPPRKMALDSLLRASGAAGPFRATLAGAKIVCEGGTLRIAREAADRRGRAPEAIALEPGRRAAWDGRFELAASAPGLSVRPLGGIAARLAPDQRAALRAVHAIARPALPAVMRPDGSVFLPSLSDAPEVDVRCLIMARLNAACGATDHERAIVAWRTYEEYPKFAA